MNQDALRTLFPNASDDFLAKNAGVSTPAPRPMPGLVVNGPETKRLRQNKAVENKWEADYRTNQLEPYWQFIHREVALRLANGLTYKLDYLVASMRTGSLVVEGHEVKGLARSTGIAKLKMAATLYPWITFKLVTKRTKKRGGGWAIETVLP